MNLATTNYLGVMAPSIILLYRHTGREYDPDNYIPSLVPRLLYTMSVLATVQHAQKRSTLVHIAKL